jgi:hypothetical protein
VSSVKYELGFISQIATFLIVRAVDTSYTLIIQKYNVELWMQMAKCNNSNLDSNLRQ